MPKLKAERVERPAKTLSECAYEWGYQNGLKAAAPKWISVEEPPKDMRKVFVYLWDGTMAVTYYNPLSEMWDFNHDYKITHWMKLPEPPEGVERCSNEKQ